MILWMFPDPGLFESALSAALTRWEIPVESGKVGTLRAHFEAVVEANRTTNLTRITDPLDAAVKHYADSLALLLWIRDRKITVHTVLDVGSGAGFPAVPLAVMRPDWLITALDATRKKVTFLSKAAAALRLTNVQCEHAHSQHWKPGKTFDLVLCRALTKLPATLQHTARHVRPEGWLISYKTVSIPRGELTAAAAMALRLRLSEQEHYPYDLQTGDATLRRLLCVYHKLGDAAGPES